MEKFSAAVSDWTGFLIQRAQNKTARAMSIKLTNESSSR